MTYDRNEITTASNAEADLLCPGRFLAQKSAAVLGKEVKESQDAAFGRRIHHALATNNGESLAPAEYSIFESCQQIEAKVLERVYGLDAAKAAKSAIREEPLVIKAGLYRWEHGGTPDAVFNLNDTWLVVEYKTLAGDILGSPLNQQMRDQVVLVTSHAINWTHAHAAVIQPLVTHDPVVCMYLASDVERAARELGERVRASHKPDSPRVAGHPQCDYCTAKPTCPEYTKWAVDPLCLPLLADPAILAVSDWTPEQRVQFLEKRGAAQKWLDETYEEMKDLAAKDPDSIPGWRLKPGAERIVETQTQAIFERYERLGGSLASFMACLEVGLGKLEKALQDATGARGRALEKAMETLLAGLVTRKPDRPSLRKAKR